MINIARFSLNNSRLTILFLIFVVITGVYVYLDYPKQEDPSIVIREAVVTAFYPGMSTERVEDLITRKLEEKIREIGEVDEITSDSKTGVSLIHVIIKDQYADLEPIWQDLRNKMDDVVQELPEGTIGPFVEDEYGLTAIATIALWSDGFSLAEMRQVARDTRDRLYTLKGIQKVELYGIQEERIYLEFSNSKMAKFGLTPNLIGQTLREQNILLPGGKVNVFGQEIIIEPSGNFDDVEAIESVMIPIPETEKVTPLRDVVTIIRDYVDPPEQPVYFNGHPAIILSISIMEGVNSVEFGERLTHKIKTIEQTLPIGYKYEYATYQPDLVQVAVNGAISNLMQTLVIVLAVVIVFLGLRTGLIVGSFVPMAMLLGLVVMSFMDIELQRMSIASMIIALGMLVDNGIVVAEDIRTRMEAGQARLEAVTQAGETLAIPLLTSSLTTILAFAPMLLADGGTGEYTLSLAQVVTIVLMASWFLAMYMTPAMCFWFMKVEPINSDEQQEDPYSGRFYAYYQRFLQTVLGNRLLVIGILIAAMAAAGYAFRYVVVEFFPAGDRNQFLVYLDLPAGTRADKTADTVQQLTAWMGNRDINPEISGTIAYVGAGGPRFFLSLSPMDPDPHLAFIVVNTETTEQVPEMVQRVRQYILEQIPNARGRVKAMWLGASETGLMEIRIKGSDSKVLQAKAEHLLDKLRSIPGTLDIEQDWENKLWKVNVQIDQARAHRAGVTSQEIADSLSAYVAFAVTLPASRSACTTVWLPVQVTDSPGSRLP
ncbi:MAG: efflux RND transporter permease subunit, partial [Pseudomonadota bacterium]